MNEIRPVPPLDELRVVRLTLASATPDAWAPFGTIPGDEGTPGDASEVEFLWADGAVNFIGHTNDELRFLGDTPLCELLNRHDTHTQTLMPYDTDAYCVVAPASVDFSDPAHLDAVRAFHLPRYAVVHLARGTWHWGPYPLRAASVRLLNVQGRGYPADNGIAHLARDRGVAFAVARTF